MSFLKLYQSRLKKNVSKVIPDNFSLFLLVVSICIFLHSFLRQTELYGQFSVLQYFYDFKFDIISVSIFKSRLSILDYIPVWLPRWMEVIGGLLIAIPSIRRAAGGLLFLGAGYVSLFNYAGYGVGDPVFAVVGLILVFCPGTNEKEQQISVNVFIGVLAGMYLCSAMAKMNPEFLSGDTLRFELAKIFKVHVQELYASFNLYQPASWFGVVIELAAAIIIFSRLEGVAFVAAAIFHAFNAAQINWALSVILLPASFPFLLGWDRFNRYRYTVYVLAVIPLIHLMGLFLSQPRIIDMMGGRNYSLGLTLIPFVFLGPLLYMQRRSIFFVDAMLVSKKNRRWLPKFLGLSLCLIFFCMTVVFHWPTPLGFTQFSGIRAYRGDAAVVVVRDDKSDIWTSVHRYFLARWDMRLLSLDRHEAVYSFPSVSMADQFISELCKRSPWIKKAQFFIGGQGFPSPGRNPDQNILSKKILARVNALSSNEFKDCN